MSHDEWIRIKKHGGDGKIRKYKLPTTLNVAEFINKIMVYAAQDIYKLDVDDHDAINRIIVIAYGYDLYGNELPADSARMQPERTRMIEKYGTNIPLMTFYVAMT